jgi:hypothetical protein
MDVHFVSTLTPDDEDHYAPVVLAAVQAILDRMPIAYTMRIRTANARVFEHTKADPAPVDDDLDRPRPGDEPRIARGRVSA